jgi:hypothetical protein
MLVNEREIYVGSDPEVFLSRNGEPVSAYGLVPGTKDKPFPVDQGAVQLDGMAAEFNIAPAANKEEFLYNLSIVMRQLQMMTDGYNFHPTPVAMFTDQVMNQTPDECKRLGCTPDYTAYGGYQNPQPFADGNMRTAGGHIHIGGFHTNNEHSDEHMQSMCRLIRLMDKYVGVPSLLWDKEDRRRELYGKAGAFRPKKFGVEYRTLSNAWVLNPKLSEFVYDATLQAVDAYEKNEEGTRLIRETINNSVRDNVKAINPEGYDRVMSIIG